MPKIELECPTCGEQLALDAGFAGGVCRCSQCGTIMTVPRAPEDTVERVRRPESPTAAPSAPPDANANGTAPAPAAGTPATAGARGHDDDRDGDAQVLTTESGRTLHLDRTMVIPTARRKRPVVRALTAAAMIGALAGVTGLIGYALFVAVSDPIDDDTVPPVIGHFDYDPDVNVYALDRPNVLGLSLHPPGPVAVVVDASGASRQWLTLVQEAVRVGVTRDDGDGEDDAGVSRDLEVGLVYAVEGEPRVLADEPVALRDLGAERVRAFHEPILAAGVGDVDAALTAAQRWSPSQVILITGRSPDDAVLTLLEQWIGANDSAAGDGDEAERVVDLVLINAPASDAVESFFERHPGRLLRLTQSQLTRWHRAADVGLN